MSYSAFTDAETNLSRNAVEAVISIRAIATVVLKELKDTYAAPHPAHHWGVKFESLENGDFLLDTPFGKGKGRLDFEIDGSGIVGRYVILKEFIDSYGKPAMREVWAFRLSRSGVVSHGDNGEHCHDLHAPHQVPWGGRLALSIFYSIGRAQPLLD